MRKLKRLWKILRITNVDKMLTGFVLFTFVISFPIYLAEPNITTYGDSLWYAFTVITTIGFGDYYAVTLIGRICTVILGLYAMLIVALIPGVVVSYYVDFVQNKVNDTAGEFMEKLENLEHLSVEELKEISSKIRERRYQ